MAEAKVTEVKKEPKKFEYDETLVSSYDFLFYKDCIGNAKFMSYYSFLFALSFSWERT